MRFKSITIQNFMSIKSAVIPLENQGLTLINGKNLDNEALNNNGAGKSSIIESIVYAIYGKTLRGIKGDSIVNNVTNNNTKIFLDFIDDDGVNYRIARYRKHSLNKNKSFLYREGVDITPKSEADFNDVVAKLFQMDYSTFTSSILYSAESFKFTSATDAEMKSTFDTMLGLDVLTKCLENTKLRIKHVDTIIYAKNYDMEDYNRQLEDIQESIDNDTKSRDEFNNSIQLKIKAKQQQVDEINQELIEYTTDKAEVESKLNTTKTVLDGLKKELDDAKVKAKQVNQLKQVLADTEVEISSFKKKINMLDRELLQLNAKVKSYQTKQIVKLEAKIDGLNASKLELDTTIGQPCPTCGQPLTEDSIAPAKKEYDEKIAQVQEDIKAIQELIEDTTIEIVNTEDSIKEYKESLKELQEDKETYEKLIEKSQSVLDDVDNKSIKYEEFKDQEAELQIEVKTLEVKIKSHKVTLANLQQDLDELSSSKNPFDGLIVTDKARFIEVTNKLESAQGELAELLDERECLEFWLKAYSNQGIKSYILDSITPYLNRRVNKYLSKLANNHIEVKFSTQTQLKTGEKREKFSLEITNKDGGTTYTSNSGGERRRIDIAVNLALQDLVASRSSKKINIAVFDEIFDTLDNTGVEKVIELLQELSKEKSSIFVISHNEHLKSYFDNVITITKKNGCSVLE